MPMRLKPNWLEEYNYDDTVATLAGLAWKHSEEAGPYRVEIQKKLLDRDYVGLASLNICYRSAHPLELYHARQCRAFFEKFEPLRSNIDRKGVAFRKFQEAEEQCRSTNRKFRSLMDGLEKPPTHVLSVLIRAAWKISKCLGEFPALEDLAFSFGPGANTSVKASASSARWKLDAPLECSANFAPAASLWLHEVSPWVQHFADIDKEESFIVPIDVVPGKLQFVPKNYKTDRSIVVEPLLNSFFQKGIGKFIRGRLHRVGIDLTDQTKNQRLARQGSIYDDLATIDLSSASDTISKEVVRWLLPEEWYNRLSELRTSSVTFEGRVIHLEKFSSMGNAFTFELESLIFWALSSSVCESLGCSQSTLSIYGDDIVIDSTCYDLLKEVLEYCGFSVNTEKSYASGPFRESCGKDYVLGFDIRPFYQKKLLSGQTLFSLHNYYMRNLEFDFAREVLSLVHPALQIWGPDKFGDGHLIGSWKPRKRTKKILSNGWCGDLFDTFVTNPRRSEKHLAIGDKLLPVYSIYCTGSSDEISEPSDHYVLRGQKGYRRISIYTLGSSVFV